MIRYFLVTACYMRQLLHTVGGGVRLLDAQDGETAPGEISSRSDQMGHAIQNRRDYRRSGRHLRSRGMMCLADGKAMDKARDL